MSRNILITIEYDGTGFSGWQRQPGQRTVQGELEQVLTEICGTAITIDGVSRTDAGVHALGQRASFGGDFGIPADRIPKAANDRLSSAGRDGAIRIVRAVEVPEGFHARFDSRGKMYRYVIRNARDMEVFLRNHRYQVREPLDVDAMRKASEAIRGTHDFAAFQAAGGTPRETTVRTITHMEVTAREIREGVRDISIDVAGDGFLYNMVRIITGTLVDVGLGKIPAEEVAHIVGSCDRTRAGHTAPPQGLYLMEVYYPDEAFRG